MRPLKVCTVRWLQRAGPYTARAQAPYPGCLRTPRLAGSGAASTRRADRTGLCPARKSLARTWGPLKKDRSDQTLPRANAGSPPDAPNSVTWRRRPAHRKLAVPGRRSEAWPHRVRSFPRRGWHATWSGRETPLPRSVAFRCLAALKMRPGRPLGSTPQGGSPGLRPGDPGLPARPSSVVETTRKGDMR